MAFWKKKSEDPWDMDPNQRREPAAFYERESDPTSESVEAERTGSIDAAEEVEEAPACPWCGNQMIRAYLLGGQDAIRFTDQKPHGFWGSLGHEKTYLCDDATFLSGNYKSCWQCKPCRKLVIDVPKPDESDPRSGTIWDGNPVAPHAPENSRE